MSLQMNEILRFMLKRNKRKHQRMHKQMHTQLEGVYNLSTTAFVFHVVVCQPHLTLKQVSKVKFNTWKRFPGQYLVQVIFTFRTCRSNIRGDRRPF